MRVLGHNVVYPQMSETYIGDELEALRLCGMDVALSRDKLPVVPSISRIDVPLYESLEEGISRHDPDLILMHWASTAIDDRKRCAMAKIPFAVRTHSFDWSIDASSILDPWCIGVWHLPHRDERGSRIHTLPTLAVESDPQDLHAETRSRSAISVSAGLPKKDWPMLLRSVKSIEDCPLNIVIARTNGYASLPDRVSDLAARMDVACTVESDVPYDEVQAKLIHYGVLVYSVGSGVPVGQPRSVIEGALAGIPLVVPEHPGIRGIVGEIAHFYTAGDDRSLSQALRVALERPHPLAERRELARRVRHIHASRAAHEMWASALTDAFLKWRTTARECLRTS